MDDLLAKRQFKIIRPAVEILDKKTNSIYQP